MEKIGFLGFGNMGSSIAKGLIKGGKISPKQIFATNKEQGILEEYQNSIGICPVTDNRELAQTVDLLFLCTKPDQIFPVIEEIKDCLNHKVVISIAAGIDFQSLKKELPPSCEALAMVPNLPVTVGQGLFSIDQNHNLSSPHLQQVTELLESCGLAKFVSSEDFAIYSAIAGCGPGLVPLLVEALADAGVKHGMTRQEAYDVVIQVFLGTATLLKETKKHPAVLKDEVCSPGGTTIRGVTTLEEQGVRHGLIQAIDNIMAK